MSKEMREEIDRVKNWKQFLNENLNTLEKGDKVEIIDKWSSHFGEVGVFDGMVEKIGDDEPDRPYRVVLKYDDNNLVRFFTKSDIKKVG
jgi:hypothetical protein